MAQPSAFEGLSADGSSAGIKEGEVMTVRNLLYCMMVVSANEACDILAEAVSGSVSSFVKLMNKRAIELGLKNTSFENATGLDDTTVNHYSCAADIATMSRELIKHEIVLKYSSLWQDSIRDGEFTLTNTNRLVRFYEGCNGLKTGSTDKAGFCVSTTAKRGNLQLIAVVMGAETREKRNEAARELLDFGFANYALLELGGEFLENCDVLFGKTDAVPLASTKFCTVIEKDKLDRVEKIYEIPETLTAPIKKGDVVGRIIYKSDGLQVGFSEVIADADVEKINIFDLFVRILERIIFSY
jgi:D-alanyl-D-alanine carboxypeptidase (penicillin-binding protein 5/6)